MGTLEWNNKDSRDWSKWGSYDLKYDQWW